LVGLAVTVRVVVVGNDGRLRRNVGSFERFIAYRRAMQTGELPARIEPEAWRRWLRSSRRSNRTASVTASASMRNYAIGSNRRSFTPE
jgi:hypothetical protein